MKYLTISGLSRFLNNLKKLIPSKMSQLTNDSGYITADQVPDITGYSKTEVDYLFNQADSNAVHLTGNETIEGAKTFTSFPTLYYGTGDNYLSFLKSASLTFGTAPQNTQTYSIRCLDKNDIIISEFSSQAQANGINNLSLRVRNTDGTNIYDRRINFNINTSGLTYFAPNIDNICSLGVADHQWKAVYANSYYLGNTQFGDIVTHNASEFLTSHQSLANYVTLDGAQTISGEKIFTTFPVVKSTHANNGIIYIKSPTTFGTAPSTTTYTYALRCVDNADTILADFIAQQGSSGSNTIQLRVRNTDGTLVYDRRVQLNVATNGTTIFAPNADNVFYLGYSNLHWKSVYANSYYLGTTPFGDIVTHNASEYASSSHTHTVNDISNFPTLATVATSGSYTDLSDKPTIPTVNNATLTIQKNGTNVQTFTANASSNKTANITVPTAVSELTNDSGFITNTSDCVHIAGNETITGEKTFSGNHIWITNSTTKYLFLKNTSWDLGQATPSSDVVYGGYVWRDKDNQDVAQLRYIDWSNGYSGIRLLARTKFTNGVKDTTGSNVDTILDLGTMPNGTRYLHTNALFHDSVIPDIDNSLTLGNTTYKWKAVYSNTYYLGSTAFGDIVTHNSSEYSLSSHTHTKAEITDFPTIPTVNNATLTIQKNGTTVKTFTANASSNVTCNITVPTKTSEITNDSGFLTSHQSLSNYSTLANTVKSLSISGKTITVTPGSGNAYTLTTQDTTYSNFVKSGSGAKAGLVPAPSTTAGTTKYLREDGTWQVPPDHTYTVNNATLTIQKNGSNVATFTSNASSNVTANITVPTKTSELTNDSGFLTSHQSLSNYLTKTTNVSEMGRYIDMHYDNATAAYDYDARLYVTSQGTAKGGGALAIAAASVTAPNLTVTNNSANGIKFGSYTLYVG